MGWRLGAVLVACLAMHAAGCADEPRPETGARDETPAGPADSGWSFAYARGRSVRVRDDRGQDRVIFAADGTAGALAWSADGSRVFASVGATIWACDIATGEARPVATVAGVQPMRVEALDEEVGAPTLVAALSAGESGAVGSRLVRIDPANGSVVDIDDRRYRYGAGRRVPYAGAMRAAVRSPTGTLSFRVESVAVSARGGGGAAERVVVASAQSDSDNKTARIFSILDLPEGDGAGVLFLDVGWAGSGGRDVLLAVVERTCRDRCRGTLYALDPGTGRAWVLGHHTEAVPLEIWNGLALVEETDGGVARVRVVRVDDGLTVTTTEGGSARWRP